MTIDYAEARAIAEDVAAPLLDQLRHQQSEIFDLTGRLEVVTRKLEAVALLAEDLRRYKKDDPDAY